MQHCVGASSPCEVDVALASFTYHELSMLIKMNAENKKPTFPATPLISLHHHMNIFAFAFLVTFAQAMHDLHRPIGLQDAQTPLRNQSEQTDSGLNFTEKIHSWSEPKMGHGQPERDRLGYLMRRRLRAISKKAVKSVKSSDGDIIDCVPRNEQPAFNHPTLKDHILQSFPSTFPTTLGSNRQPRHRLRRPIALPQIWHNDGSCPLGTIPLRRTSEQDFRRWAASTSSPTAYGTKRHKPARSQPSSVASRNADGDPLGISINGDGLSNHEHAIAYIEGEEIYGTSAVLSVWDPWVEASNEFSLSQIWILGGSFDNDLNSIEAGWQVSPELYGDGRPRFFIYWTTDGYEATGCYNLLCSGFVQTSDTVAIGAAISPVSRVGSSQYQIEIMIWKDPRQGNWWMAFEGSHIVGYWPAELFSHLSNYAANMVEWGGEVVNSRPDSHHTGTQMGSGRFAEGGFGAASFFHSLQVVDAHNNLQPISNLQTLAENPNCYDIKSLQDQTWGSAFYYGGPGRNQLCS